MCDARRGAWLDWTAAVTAGGVNLPVALLALYLAFEAFRFGWRWAAEVAVRATDAGLVPHRSLFMRSILWAEIEDVRFVQLAPDQITVAMSADFDDRIKAGEVERIVADIEAEVKAYWPHVKRLYIRPQQGAGHAAAAD